MGQTRGLDLIKCLFPHPPGANFDCKSPIQTHVTIMGYNHGTPLHHHGTPHVTIMGHNHGTQSWDIIVGHHRGHHRGTSSWDTIMGHHRGTPSWDIIVRHYRGTSSWDTIVGHHRGTPSWDINVGHHNKTSSLDSIMGSVGVGTLPGPGA